MHSPVASPGRDNNGQEVIMMQPITQLTDDDEEALCIDCLALRAAGLTFSDRPFGDGRYVSNRHEQAREDGKFTAGEAAKVLAKKIGAKVSAKQVVSAYKLLNAAEPEWHHSGFYRPKAGGQKTMGRTFFFSEEEIEAVAARWNEVVVLQQVEAVEAERKATTMVRGIYYRWEKDYGGRYGKKRNYKVLDVYEGPEADAPRNFTSCDEKTFKNAKKQAGKTYFGWDEPSVEEFKQ